MPPTSATPTTSPLLWAKVIDHTRCIGCHACTTACKSENEVPLSVTRTYVKYVDVGHFPQTRRSFQVTRCNQCEEAPCVTACPTAAMHRRPDGIVDFDKSICIGCKACIAACPYDAIFINPEDKSAEKCNFCAHRLDVGLEPACVVVCPTQALLVGDMNDPLSAVSEIIHRDAVAVRRPEKGTRPKVFYKGADQVTLDPLAARRPDGGLFMWSEQGNVSHQVHSGHPGHGNSSAAAVLSYDVLHRAPWDWRVSAYTFTKSIAAGAYLVPLLLGALGLAPFTSMTWGLHAPLVAMIGLAVTGGLLVWDLEHPERFWMVLLKPQWRSWLVRGGFIITAYGGVLAVHLAATFLGRADLTPVLGWAGGPLAAMTAVYTAYLFAQAKARDLWQSPLLPAHLLVQAIVAGAAVLLVLNRGPGPEVAVVVTFRLALLAHLVLVLGEASMGHPTEHATLAARAMTRGAYAHFFWVSIPLAVLGLVFAAATPVIAALAGLGGLFLYEHAFVQAGQSVPLA
ncbi:MAG: polysulfide reductase NrfD [Gemmatimonadetes bacterium]|nr:polysulfide reductase NrfD [Gemmatimonadota bacterium]MDA1103677.1 polysulfide reductase NrfD [Gemmatimonadota bacterium]